MNNSRPLTPAERKRMAALVAKHSDLIKQTNQQLAMNFDTPTQRIINHACSQMGIARIDWEKLDAFRSGSEFQPVPPHILRRWESY